MAVGHDTPLDLGHRRGMVAKCFVRCYHTQVSYGPQILLEREQRVRPLGI